MFCGPDDETALEAVDLPQPRDECVRSVLAARDTVHDRNGATRAEIVAALTPERDHRIGLTGAQMVGTLNMRNEYRRWWWETVARPGLEALSSVERSGVGGDHWIPANPDGSSGNPRCDESAGATGETIESVQEIRTVVREGYLFELAYDDGDGERRLVVAYDRVVRPAARPVDAPRAVRFELLSGDTLQVSVPDIVALEPISIDQVPAPTRRFAISAMATAGRDQPERVSPADCKRALEAVGDDHADPDDLLVLGLIALREDPDSLAAYAESLFDRLTRVETDEGKAILETLIDRAERAPASIEPHVAALADLVVDSPYATQAAECIGVLAEADPASALDAVPTLASITDSMDGSSTKHGSSANDGSSAERSADGSVSDDDVHRWVIYTFSRIAAAYPEELVPAIDLLCASIRAADEGVRTNALSAVGRIASAYPDAAEPIVTEVATMLTDDDGGVRANAVGLLGDVAQTNPEPVAEHIAAIARLLTDPEPDVRHNASITLVRAREANPDAIRASHERLERALDDDNPEVRRNACSLIANAFAPVSADRLRDLQETDPDEVVRERADWAANRLGREE